MGVRKFRKGQDIVEYSRKLAIEFHDGDLRDTGEPFSDHPIEVADFADSGLKESSFKPPSKVAALLHDVPEDKKYVKIYNPFNPPVLDKYDPTRLNDLFEEAGNAGRYACYLIHRLTRRGENYFDYMMKKFSVNGDGVRHVLDLIAIWLKICDRTSNSNPDEELDISAYAAAHPRWNDAEEDARRLFRHKKIRNADDNLKLYLPMAEMTFVVGMGLNPNGTFSEGKALNNEIFNYEGVRQLFKQCYSMSLQSLDKFFPYRDGTHGELVVGSGYNRGAQEIAGYQSILQEVLRENKSLQLKAASSSASRLR